MNDGVGAPSPRPRGTVTVRSRNARSLGATMAVVGAAGLVTTLVEGLDSLLQFGAPLALFGLLGWAAFWQPHVEVSDGGISVANTLRTIEVPWPAVESVSGRYGLQLQTAYGPVTAWGASAPTGRDRARQRVGEAAEAVFERMEELQRAGYLDDRRLERPGLRITWHLPVIISVGTLLIASIGLPFLA